MDLTFACKCPDSSETLKSLYFQTRQILRDHGVEKPDLEARILLKHVFAFSDSDLILLSSSTIEHAPDQGGMIPHGDGRKTHLESLIRRRLAGEPMSRILGTREFWGLPFEISADTLDPRPDTETLVDAVLDQYKKAPPKKILDIGTGSGCILIALLHEFPESSGIGTDLSAGAVVMARRNAEANHVASRAAFIQTRWVDGVEGPFDLIVSNPPYIPTSIIPNLGPEVKNHDPILALDGGEDGLEAYKIVIPEIKKRLAPDGRAFFETGFDQAEQVARLVEEYGATPVRIISDMGGNQRVVEWDLGISKKTLARLP